MLPQAVPYFRIQVLPQAVPYFLWGGGPRMESSDVGGASHPRPVTPLATCTCVRA